MHIFMSTCILTRWKGEHVHCVRNFVQEEMESYDSRTHWSWYLSDRGTRVNIWKALLIFQKQVLDINITLYCRQPHPANVISVRVLCKEGYDSIRAGFGSLDLNGQWHEGQLFPHLRDIIQKHREYSDGTKKIGEVKDVAVQESEISNSDNNQDS